MSEMRYASVKGVGSTTLVAVESAGHAPSNFNEPEDEVYLVSSNLCDCYFCRWARCITLEGFKLSTNQFNPQTKLLDLRGGGG